MNEDSVDTKPIPQVAEHQSKFKQLKNYLYCLSLKRDLLIAILLFCFVVTEIMYNIIKGNSMIKSLENIRESVIKSMLVLKNTTKLM